MRKASLLLFVLCGILTSACKEKSTETAKAEPTYLTMEIELSDRLLTTVYPAAISGVQTVEIRPQVSGMITDIRINDGDFVRKDSTLFVIAQTPYTAA